MDRGTLCGGQTVCRGPHAHDEVAAPPESRNRKWLYRVLDERDLIVTYGGQRIWNLFVTGPGEPLPRFVSALKLAPARYAGLELGRCSQEAWNRRGRARGSRWYRLARSGSPPGFQSLRSRPLIARRHREQAGLKGQ